MRLALIAAAVAAAVAGSASAQTWTSYGDRHERPYGYETGRYYSNPYDSGRRGYSRDWSFNGQADVPGDYRCDAFWDANRTDCGAAWRDQRHRSSYGYRSGYGHGHSRYGYGRGYGSSHYGGGAVYPGAYGRPDLVYGGGRGGDGHGGYSGGPRDQARIDWCRWNYRSYDPSSGYYRAYSGRLIWCG